MTGLMRKHGKLLLAVIGSLLMIVFVLPTGRNNDTTAASYVRGTLDGKKVTNAQISFAADDINILKTFQKPLGNNMRSIPLLTYFQYFHGLPLTGKEDNQAVHWYLLLKEADSFNIVPTEADITGIISSLNLTESEMDEHLKALGRGQKSLRRAVGDAISIVRLAELTMNSTEVSLPEVEFLANQDLAKIQVAYATLDGAKDWEKSPEPTDEQVKKQFELYKDIVATPIPGTKASMAGQAAPMPPMVNGHTYPFGYKYPDRVKVEFLRFDKEELANLMKRTSGDYDAAYNYYTQHPGEFKSLDAMGPPTTQASTRPAVKSWDEVKEELVRRQVDQRVTKLLRKIVDRASTLAGDAWKNVEVKSGFRAETPAAQWPDYKRIEGQIAGNKEYLGFKPAHTTTDWLSAEGVDALPFIGKAELETPNRAFHFGELATHVKELTGEAKDDYGRFFLQVGPEGPVLSDDSGNLYLYRVIAADKAHPPASVDEVRGQVVEDLKKIASYEKAQAEAKEMARKATAGDLLGIARNKNIPANVSKELTQTDTIPELGDAPGLVEAAFAMTKNPAATQPMKDGKRASATTTFARDNVLRVHVLELVNYAPASAAEFAARRPELARQFAGRSRAQFMFKWLDLDAIAKRLKFVPTHPFEGKDEEDKG
jgi:hypothetical protein